MAVAGTANHTETAHVLPTGYGVTLLQRMYIQSVMDHACMGIVLTLLPTLALYDLLADLAFHSKVECGGLRLSVPNIVHAVNVAGAGAAGILAGCLVAEHVMTTIAYIHIFGR